MSDGMIPGLSSSSNPFFLVLLLRLPPPLPDPEADVEYLSVATRIHWSERVMPGVLAVRARLRPRRRLMSADFPTFGNPMIPTLRERSFNPLLFRLSFTCLPALYTALEMACVPCPRLASTNSTSSTPSSPPPITRSLPSSSYLLRSFLSCAFLFRSSPPSPSSHLSAPSLSYASLQLSLLRTVTASILVSTTTRGRPAVHFPTEGWAVALGARASRTSMTTSTDLSVSESCLSALAMWPGYQLTLGRW
mmetsp:Transcript_1838/g.4032  ORF Transcript_1838/g.4032 Transcript_1838/m.4032 type:complete len:249 (-) Transcript_1838:647-1393(-)